MVPPLVCFLLGIPETQTQCPPTPCPPVLHPQFLDADNLLVNPDTLRLLMAENKTVVAPMLESRAAYANFWCGMTAQVSWGRGGQSRMCTHIRTHTHSQFPPFTRASCPALSFLVFPPS